MPVDQGKGGHHAGVRHSARRRVAPYVRGGELLHAAHAEQLPRRSRGRRAAAGADGRGRCHTIRFLGTQTARVGIDGVRVESGRLRAEVTIENLGGHKLPTAYPSRRAWLHVVVRDAGGRAVFESGATNLDGSIQGNDNDADALKFEPHYDEIRSADQVQIYETIIAGADGAVTTGLVEGGAISEGQPAAAARLRQAHRGARHRRARRRAWTIPISSVRETG